MIEKYKDLIHLLDSRSGIPPLYETKVVEAYVDIFGKTSDFKTWQNCRCPSSIRLFYSELKKKLNEYERTLSENI